MKIHFGERLKEARELRKLSQERLGELVGKDRQQVIRWEKGRAKPKHPDLERIASALEFPVTWFFEAEPSEPATLVPSDPIVMAVQQMGLMLRDLREEQAALREERQVLIRLVEEGSRERAELREERREWREVMKEVALRLPPTERLERRLASIEGKLLAPDDRASSGARLAK